MSELLQIIGLMVISFFGTLIATKLFIWYCNKVKLTGIDKHKAEKHPIPASGGLPVLCGIFSAMFMYSLYMRDIGLLAIMLSLLIVTVVGFMDDYAKQYGGMRQWTKPLMTLPAAIPLIALKMGHTTMSFPFVGEVYLGWAYIAILIPIGIVGASNMVNMLAGYNGLEAGMGVLYISTLAAIALELGRYSIAILGFASVAALFAFLIFNWYPAKIFPGDSLTYLLGALMACMAIGGDMEKAALVCSIPFFVEFVLKARSRFKAQSFGVLGDDGKIHYSGKIYSLPHIFARTGIFTERGIVMMLIFMQAFFCLIARLI